MPSGAIESAKYTCNVSHYNQVVTHQHVTSF